MQSSQVIGTAKIVSNGGTFERFEVDIFTFFKSVPILVKS